MYCIACVDLDSKRLKYPSKILNPKSQDKKEAQYFFSDSTVKFLTKSVSKLKFTHVICVGCPTIYENLQEKLRRNSLLLDIDARLQRCQIKKPGIGHLQSCNKDSLNI